jgi:hypothetical protein
VSLPFFSCLYRRVSIVIHNRENIQETNKCEAFNALLPDILFDLQYDLESQAVAAVGHLPMTSRYTCMFKVRTVEQIIIIITIIIIIYIRT